MAFWVLESLSLQTCTQLFFSLGHGYPRTCLWQTVASVRSYLIYPFHRSRSAAYDGTQAISSVRSSLVYIRGGDTGSKHSIIEQDPPINLPSRCLLVLYDILYCILCLWSSQNGYRGWPYHDDGMMDDSSALSNNHVLTLAFFNSSFFPLGDSLQVLGGPGSPTDFPKRWQQRSSLWCLFRHVLWPLAGWVPFVHW